MTLQPENLAAFVAEHGIQKERDDLLQDYYNQQQRIEEDREGELETESFLTIVLNHSTVNGSIP